MVVDRSRHEFAFGNIGFDLVAHANGRGAARTPSPRTWLALFDTATLPFYWGQFEPVRGRPDTVRLLNAARWFADHGVRLKGHPLVWHTVKAAWLRPLPLDEVERLTRERVRREVGDFAGLIDSWDAINEAVIMPVFDKNGRHRTRSPPGTATRPHPDGPARRSRRRARRTRRPRFCSTTSTSPAPTNA